MSTTWKSDSLLRRVTDATDGGIVCFTCNSLITMNTIISADRQLLGGINMVDVGPNSFNYTGVVVSSNTIIARSNFIKVGIAVGGMVWGTDNRTASRTFGGSITNNVLSSGPSGYFGFGIAGQSHASPLFLPTIGSRRTPECRLLRQHGDHR